MAAPAGSGSGNFDMPTLNETGPQAGRYLYRTHEVGSNGAVTVVDLWTGESSLVAQEPHYQALDGLAWTPWGTVLFAEERKDVEPALRDPDYPEIIRGLVYEYDPRTGDVAARPALGARSHEGIRVDPQGNVYGISESDPDGTFSGAIFKFVPRRSGDLTDGQLYALRVLDAVGRVGPAVWEPLDMALARIDSDGAAIAVGATGWGRPEDVEIATSTGNLRGGANVMYVASTRENLVLGITRN